MNLADHTGDRTGIAGYTRHCRGIRKPYTKADLTVIEMGIDPQPRALKTVIRDGRDNTVFYDSLLGE